MVIALQHAWTAVPSLVQAEFASLFLAARALSFGAASSAPVNSP